jgi:L-arabinokinase
MPDYMNLADVVLGKIGYGTVTECLMHGTPLIYVPRSSWPEEIHAEEFLTRHNAGVKLSPDDFYSGHWSDAITSAWNKIGAWDEKQFNSIDPIAVVADKIISFVT